jgi:hypothetical protein
MAFHKRCNDEHSKHNEANYGEAYRIQGLSLVSVLPDREAVVGFDVVGKRDS